MKVTIIPIVIGITVTYSIIKIGQNTEKSPGDLQSPNPSEKLSANAGVKNCQRVKQ